MRQVAFVGPQEAAGWVAGELGSDYEVKFVNATPSEVAEALRHCDIFLDASMKVALDQPKLAAAKNLKLVITATTGTDHIDGHFLETHRVPLLTLKSETALLRELTPAAELSWLLLMACARRLRAAIKHVDGGGWNREEFPGLMLKGRTLGLIGCGRIGGWMARYAEAFGMKILGHDPHLGQWPEQIQRAPLPELLAASHFISIHVHLSDETRGLLGPKEIALMRPGAVLINTSRGAIVDETALLDGLESGRIGALGVDVVEGEPEITRSRLWQFARTHNNCIITPHIGGFSPDALQLVMRHTARRIAQFFSNQPS